MCGIAGIIGPKARDKADKLKVMQQIIRHRGPDDSGECIGEGAALAHVRLAILDLTKAGRNPMFSPDGRYALIYNGEIFNYLELKEEIGERYSFKTSTDTEVILAAYILWGRECLHKFIGMFAFAIWDTVEKQLFCARDRFGIKPFYYTVNNGHLYFASEIKALLAAGCPREANYSVIYKYLKWGLYDFDENTFFKDIKRLGCGFAMTWKDGQMMLCPYWDIGNQEDAKITEDEAAVRVYEILQDSVRLALRSDVPLGINLSGGLDSSILTALLDSEMKNGKYPLEGFTQDYKHSQFSERLWVKEIANRTKRAVNFSFMSDADFYENHQALNWYQDEPYGGAPVVGYIGVYQGAVRRNTTVLLDGNGLDEALCGYRQYHNIFLQSLAKEGDPELDRFITAYTTEWGVTDEQAWKAVMQHQSMDNNTAARDGTNAVGISWLDKNFETAFQNNFPTFKKIFKSAVKNAMYQDVRYTKIPRALRFNDHVSMAFSRELRVPFLDHRLFELCFSLPDKVLFAGFRPKGLLRKVFGGILPNKVRLAPKRHIQTPQSEWFASSLRSWVGDILHSQSFSSRGIFDVDLAIKVFNDLEGKKIANSFFLWQVINLETWFDMFIDSVQIPIKAPDFLPFEYETVSFAG